MFDHLLNHIKEQREKQQYINALATMNELQALLLKEFSDLQKGTAAQQSVEPTVETFCLCPADCPIHGFVESPE